MRKLPVYILADTSGSMAGDKIQAVNQGLRDLHNELLSDAASSESAYLSVITFDSKAKQVAPLTEVEQFTPPTLSASGMTNLGDALNVLGSCMKSEVQFNAGGDNKGDWKPLVFLYTDGAATDSDYPIAIADLKKKFSFNLLALAVGAGADTTVLKTLTDQVMQCADSTTEIKKFFALVTASVKAVSTSTQSSGAPVALPPPPSSFKIVP